ncbi:UPF0158 family protein [Paenisporosarcina sp. TG20]|uniref:UPF0158 family protein n=1 Tax=Paenisporosarcina sp. TG20 TaxID=1211706 RepID=UPI0002FF5EFA|nr:UPF0158 family protein [Paenisporosarcina sp. TG20]
MNLNEELIEAFLTRDVEMEYVLDRQTGEIFLDASETITGEPKIDWDDEETAENLIQIPQISSSDAFEVMVMFTKEQLHVVRDQLLNTLNGRKPFRNFKDKVHIMNLQESWYRYENECAKKWLIQWLEENDIEVDLVSEG